MPTITSTFAGGTSPAVQVCEETDPGVWFGNAQTDPDNDFFVVVFQPVNGVYEGTIINPTNFGNYGQSLGINKDDSALGNVIGKYKDSTGTFTCVVAP